MSIPFLPGNSIRDPTRVDYRKGAVHTFSKGFPVVNAPQGSEIYLGANVAALAKRGNTKLITFPKRQVTTFKETIPSWVAFDRQVLRFYGYFKEAVHERADETYRVRRVVIMFFLADETIKVDEPKMENSGIPQGGFIRRHRIVKDGNSHYTASDFNLGIDITFYGRTIRINDCDQFTAQWYEAMGRPLNDSEGVPDDPYTKLQEYRHSYKQRSSAPKPEMDKLRQFIQNDRKVLRFFGSWDDREAMFGDMRPFVINYYLADDTISIGEVHDPNAGRDSFPSFFKRAPLPKTIPGVMVSGPVEYYTPYDLVVGQYIEVYGRKVLLRDCDEFTRDYYTQHLGIDQANTVPVEQPPLIDISQPIPPHMGFGTDEDSLQSFYHLVPRPPAKDIHKFMSNDGKILRFAAKMETTQQEDVDRRFIISYYLADETASVYEIPVANSGIVGGKFLERSRPKLPDKEFKFYTRDQFQVGNTIVFSGQTFLLYDSDEYTKKMLSAPQSDRAGALHAKLGTILMEREKAMTQAFKDRDLASTTFVSRTDLKEVLYINGVALSDSDWTALFGYWDPLFTDKVPWKKFLDTIIEAVFTRATEPIDTSLLVNPGGM
jgi:hypothetical protein